MVRKLTPFAVTQVLEHIPCFAYTPLTGEGIVRRWNNSGDLYFEGNGLNFPVHAGQYS